ncbi:MAG: D-alanine--D-alanine ligase [Clostridiales bacterium]|nr:D-alanine--D-alanine ligase [Clostridiales bacterium]
MKKINVGIIFGGESTEHEVSRRSAVHVITSLDKTKYNFRLIEVTKDGTLNLYENYNTDIICSEIIDINNTLSKKSVEISDGIFIENEIDVVFPVIHGTGGEDGVIQGFLEMCKIPYVGSGVASSAIGFDKALSKVMFSHAGIHQAEYIYITTENIDFCMLEKEVAEQLGYPVFVKPANGGSSVGIFKVKEKTGLRTAVAAASAYDRKIVIEAFVPGREFECAVLGGFSDVEALGVGEIVPCNEFYDYNAKYVNEDSVGIIPAPISNELIEEIKRISIEAFKSVDGYGLARVDFFITDEGSIVLNEINTMPGFTSISMYPKIWVATGKSNTELMTDLIDLAIDKKKNYKFLKDFCGEPKNV